MKAKKYFSIFILFIIIFLHTYCFAIDNNSLYAEAAIIMDANTGVVFFQKNMNKKMYPASTTKIMTAILTIENCNLDDIVTVNYNAISTIPSGYATADLKTDEQITIKQLLEVLLVHSANDAANVLGMHVGGSIESFVSMMNSKAQELGCTDTHFTNTYGLHDENHYTTAKDLALIAKYCMKNESFRHFVSQPSCQIAPTNNHEARFFYNTNDLINSSSKYYYKNAIGIKTGFTSEAGNCLIASSQKDGLELLSIVLNCGNVSGRRYTDSIELFDYVYGNYGTKKIANKDDVITQTVVKNGSKETKELDVILSQDINALTQLSDTTKPEPTILLDNNITAPIAAGSKVGTVSYNILNVDYTADLIASHDVEKSKFEIIILITLLTIVIALLLLLVFKKISRKK